jgi:hypothetical protein
MDTQLGHTVGDGLIVAAVAAVVIAYFYFRHIERRRRLEIAHQERLAAMDKGIPLPELPLDPPRIPKPRDPRAVLVHGIVWSALGAGAMIALRLFPGSNVTVLWPLPLPMVLLGIGLMLYYVLVTDRAR